MAKIVKDKDGIVINIGEWEYNMSGVKNPDADDLTWAEVKAMTELRQDPEMMYDADGKLIMEALNPMPDGAKEYDVDVKAIDGSGAVASDDYATQRKYAYPSIANQLDMIYHGGINAWKASIKDVKDEFPK